MKAQVLFLLYFLQQLLMRGNPVLMTRKLSLRFSNMSEVTQAARACPMLRASGCSAPQSS